MNKETFEISGNIVDVVNKKMFPGIIRVKNGSIEKILQASDIDCKNYILPGLIDSHVHIESSMVVPSEFARTAVTHGTVASISDPHEIANVLGVGGVDFMINNGKQVPFKFFFGAPSCVPATDFETSGAVINVDDIEKMLLNDDIYYLSEMMNFPGVINENEDVMAKLKAAVKNNKTIDGHAPGLLGNNAKNYFNKGISTDHECFTLDEAIEKAALGVKILIREGSAARNFDNLLPVIKKYPEQVMFCSDDKHPDELLSGHINELISRAIKSGYDLIDVLRAATLNPCVHYNIPVGMLQPGDPADFIVVDSPAEMNVLQTYIDGIKVSENKNTLIPSVEVKPVNRFNVSKVNVKDISVKADGKRIKVIEVIDGELVTKNKVVDATVNNGQVVSDTARDILKIVVLNRYTNSPPAVGFVHNFGLKSGAVASTVAHDSHNIIAVGTSDDAICQAVNSLIDVKGGITLNDGNDNFSLPLPVAGLMSTEPVVSVAEKYKLLDTKAKSLGSKLEAPFMTLSFMALLVIPELKISDKGLFDGNKFEFVSLFVE